MNWEAIPNDFSTYLRRAKIHGGWLVIATEDVVHERPYDNLRSGWDWRTSICFVPDPNHEWNLKEDEG